MSASGPDANVVVRPSRDLGDVCFRRAAPMFGIRQDAKTGTDRYC